MGDVQVKHALPRGFSCSGVVAGLKGDTARRDLGLIYVHTNGIAAGVYTKSKFPSAHVLYCKKLTPLNDFRALIINSGNANAATGQKGIDANKRMAGELASRLGVRPNQVLTSSTGIIGRDFPIETVVGAMDSLVDGLEDSIVKVAEAVMTTDTISKWDTERVRIDVQDYTVVGFAKGSGMIHPQMGTMLAYIMTDAPLTVSEINKIVKEVADMSFNRVSVDGDTSTNDSFYLISSNPVDRIDNATRDKVKDAVERVAISLAKKIASDGEGAKHLIEVTVNHALSASIAENALSSILRSNLVKCAINGNDPNWGRVLMAIGNGLSDEKIPYNLPVSIKIQGVSVFEKGEPTRFDRNELSRAMNQFEVGIDVDFHTGEHCSRGWGCDLSDEYVRINADYPT